MQRYKLLTTVVLGFINGREQMDVLLEPGAVLEFDGSTIWLVQGDNRFESTTVGLMPWMLERGDIVEIAS
jgi:hypothetical protein